jgi:hypothetical protein
MHERDPLTFETRLADAFERYVVAAPVDVDSRTLVALVATDAARHRRPTFGPLAISPRWAIVLAMLAALAVGAALVAGALLRSQPGPLGGGGNLLVFSGGTATVFDTAGTVLTRRFVETRVGGCPRLVAGGTALAASTFNGLGVRGIGAGATATTLDTSYTGGERWSVDGRVLARVRLTGGITFTTFPHAQTDNPVDVDVPNSDIGAGIGIIDSSLSPDGSTLAVLAATDRAQLPDNPDGAATDGPVDVLLIDSATGAVRPMPSHELGAVWPAMTWSSDASRVGFVAGGPDGTVTGWVVDVRDATERSFPIRAASAAPTAYALNADGTRALVAGDGVHVIDTTDGRTLVLVDGAPTGEVAWGPDGRSFAWVDGVPDPTPDAGAAPLRPILHVHAADGTPVRDIPVMDGRWAWSPDRLAMAVIDADRHVRVHFPWTGQEPQSLATPHLGGVDDTTCLAWTGDLP